MIIYDKFWKTLERSEESQYTLINHHKISASIIYRLKHNERVTTKTINNLCRILNCNVDDVVRYIPDNMS